jgi:uncharacterized protein
VTAVALGLAVGLVLGLTGAGGSILAVPLLMAGLGWTLPQAAPVALLAVCAATAFGTIVAWDMAYVRHRAALLMAAGALATAPLGVAAAQVAPLPLLTGLFAAVLAAVGLRLMLQAWRAPSAVVRASVAGDALPARGRWVRLKARGRIAWDAGAVAAIAVIGAVTGFAAGLLGVGGGFIIVPGLRAVSELSMHSVVATSLLAIALISAVAVASAAAHGVDLRWERSLPFVGGALLGMLAGRRVAPRLAGHRLQQGFAALMLATAAGLAARVGGWI